MKPVHIVDVGSSPVDGPAPYQAMLDAGLCTVTGFEAQAPWVMATKPGASYRNEVIYDGAEQTLYVTESPGMVSLLEPDQAILAKLPKLGDIGRVRKTERVYTATLDDAIQEPADFLKMDVQGTELTILQHAPRVLSEIVGLHLEVSFLPLYKGQPTAGEVDVWLRERGFIPHAFADIKGWPLTAGLNTPPHQLLEADMIYVRDFRRPEMLSANRWACMAVLADGYFRT